MTSVISPVPLRFENWQHWADRATLPACKFPGVYAIAISDTNLADTAFSVLESIVYFGMTNVGLRGRLENFHRTAALIKCEHGGADRFAYKHRNFSAVTAQLYVAQWPFESTSAPSIADKLRLKGRVLQAEYECFAAYAERFCNEMPEFNRSASPKYTAKVKLF